MLLICGLYRDRSFIGRSSVAKAVVGSLLSPLCQEVAEERAYENRQ